MTSPKPNASPTDSMPNLLYDTIGHAYPSTRREDPEVLAKIMQALGEARTVVNVGAGAGSYEPTGRQVTAIEPSDVMAAQRREGMVLSSPWHQHIHERGLRGCLNSTP